MSTIELSSSLHLEAAVNPSIPKRQPASAHGRHGLRPETMSAQSSSFSRNPGPVRRSSIGSRLSFAVSTAEQGEAVAHPLGQVQIEEEIAEIKRYEV